MPSSIPGSDISRGKRRRSSPTPPTVDARAGFPDQEARAKPALESGPAHPLAPTLRAVGRFARRKPLGALGALIVVAMLVMAAFAERIAPYGYDDTIRGARMQPPSAAHWLGTDNLSRDMWSRIVYGARVSVTVGFATIGLAIFLASVIGVSSGYFGGAYDLVVQRIVDAWLSFPYLVIILSVMGFGVPPPFPSWGAMLSGSGRTYMFRAPWMAVWPGVAISLAVFGFNMLGDALRDVLDPRLRGGAR